LKIYAEILCIHFERRFRLLSKRCIFAVNYHIEENEIRAPNIFNFLTGNEIFT